MLAGESEAKRRREGPDVLGAKPYMKNTTVVDGPYCKVLMTKIRERGIERPEFCYYSDLLLGQLIMTALDCLPYHEQTVTTSMRLHYKGAKPAFQLVGVSIMRAGEAMEGALNNLFPECRIGKVLIQRDEATALPKLYYQKLPANIADDDTYVFLLDPMLATGGSAVQCLEVLTKAGVPANRIIFVNLIACPEGLTALYKAFPEIRVVTGDIDEGLDARKYIMPGIGDYGDKYFGTT